MTGESTALLPTRHCLVDLENVKEVDRMVFGQRNLMVHLFLGPQNRKLDVDVVERLMEHSQTVRLVRTPKSGKNALDFVLAYHLGQEVLAHPRGSFHIISKDSGFDVLVELLRSRQVRVCRHPDWEDFHAHLAAPPSAAKPPVPGEPSDKLLAHLRSNPKNRPKTRKGLEKMALNYAGKDKDPELAGKRVDQLRSDGHIAFDAKGAVIYQF